MSGKYQARRSSVPKRTLGSFGLQTHECPKCGAFNPTTTGEPAPEKCNQCGEALLCR